MEGMGNLHRSVQSDPTLSDLHLGDLPLKGAYFLPKGLLAELLKRSKLSELVSRRDRFLNLFGNPLFWIPRDSLIYHSVNSCN